MLDRKLVGIIKFLLYLLILKTCFNIYIVLLKLMEQRGFMVLFDQTEPPWKANSSRITHHDFLALSAHQSQIALVSIRLAQLACSYIGLISLHIFWHFPGVTRRATHQRWRWWEPAISLQFSCSETFGWCHGSINLYIQSMVSCLCWHLVM